MIKNFEIGFCYPAQFPFSLLSADLNDKLFKTNSAWMKTTSFLVLHGYMVSHGHVANSPPSRQRSDGFPASAYYMCGLYCTCYFVWLFLQNGGLNAIPYLLRFIMMVGSGYIADYLKVKNCLSVTVVRKIFIVTGMSYLLMFVLSQTTQDLLQCYSVSLPQRSECIESWIVFSCRKSRIQSK